MVQSGLFMVPGSPLSIVFLDQVIGCLKLARGCTQTWGEGLLKRQDRPVLDLLHVLLLVIQVTF